MPSVTLIYSRSATIGGLLLRAADRWGRWSHCGVVTANGTVIEARAFVGVVESPWVDFIERTSYHELVQVEVPNLDAGLWWLGCQIGKPYDYGAILGNIFRESWESEDKWECSELVEAFLVACGRRRFRQELWRLSPNLSWSVV